MTSHCSIALLESALAGNLPTDDEASLHRHLETCDACTAALDHMAGGAAWCQEAASLLLDDDLDGAVPTRDEWSEIDFTVEHLEPSGEPNVLGRLGGYDVLEIIGRGGMGVVLKGYDRQLKRCVAIKVLAPHLAHSSLARKRFAREAQAAAAVVNPHVIAIHQVQPNGRLPFLVMPLIAGESLAQRLAVRGTLELKEILRIGMQAADGLAAAHEQGLVHRDVKPANVLLEKGVERAVLTDFGLARAADDIAMTRWGIIAGTPQYMSPEQARGEPLDGRSDLFSLGCVLYEMATGVSPFHTDSIMATMRRLVDDSPQAMASLNPELPPWFIAIVERLLKKDPSGRFGSAKEVSELLEGCLAHIQQPANVPLPAMLAKPPVRRGWQFMNIGIKGVLAMLGGLGIALLGVLLLPVENEEQPAKQSPFPKSAHYGRNNGSVMVVHDDVDLHYAFYHAGDFGTSWSGSHNTHSVTWTDEGRIVLEGERTFGYGRKSSDPFHLRVNGKEFDLRQGRVFEVDSDGSVEQLMIFPALSAARVPDSMAKLIAGARKMNEAPLTLEKLKLQLDAAKAQLRDLMKTHAPTHSLVVDVNKRVDRLQQTIKERSKLTKDSGGESVPALPTDVRFSETKELVLSMDSMKFMLDLDTDRTMDLPMRPRAGQEDMDVHPTQEQPYNLPTGLSGSSTFLSRLSRRGSLEGLKVKPADWNASVTHVRQTLAGGNVQPLKRMDYDPDESATYFFRTRAGTEGILQLVALVQEPKGIRIRYKTLQVQSPKLPTERK